MSRTSYLCAAVTASCKDRMFASSKWRLGLKVSHINNWNLVRTGTRMTVVEQRASRTGYTYTSSNCAMHVATLHFKSVVEVTAEPNVGTVAFNDLTSSLEALNHLSKLDVDRNSAQRCCKTYNHARANQTRSLPARNSRHGWQQTTSCRRQAGFELPAAVQTSHVPRSYMHRGKKLDQR